MTGIGDRCNICDEVYEGLALDCACTNYGEPEIRTEPMTVREVLIILHDQDPEAKVEFEIPEDKVGHRELPKGGDRVFITEINPCWYNNPENKWVTLK